MLSFERLIINFATLHVSFAFFLLLRIADWASKERSAYSGSYLLISSLRMILFLSICFWASALICLILFLDSGSLYLVSIWAISSFSWVISFWLNACLPQWTSFGCWPPSELTTRYRFRFAFGSHHFSVLSFGSAPGNLRTFCWNSLPFYSTALLLNLHPFN